MSTTYDIEVERMVNSCRFLVRETKKILAHKVYDILGFIFVNTTALLVFDALNRLMYLSAKLLNFG